MNAASAPTDYTRRGSRLTVDADAAPAQLVVYRLDVGLNHDLDEILAVGLRFPSEVLLGLARVPDEGVYFARAIVPRVVIDVLLPVQAGAGERGNAETPHCHGVTRCEDVIVANVGLQHPPHTLDVLWGKAPVSDRVKVAEIQLVLQAGGNAGDSASHLSREECLTTARGLMVEQDAVSGVHAVGLTVVDHRPEAIELRDGVRAARVERRQLALRRRC